MHEVGIMRNALDAAIEAATRAGALRIEKIRLRIGALSGVVPEALSFSFEAMKAGTMASEATLEVEDVPVLCHCAGCASDFEPRSTFFECPLCEQPSMDVRRGRELELVAVEVFQDDEPARP